MITQNEKETIKNLQLMLDMSDIVILYDVNFQIVKWVGFVKDMPLMYLNRKIAHVFVNYINIPNKVATTVYME